MKAKFSKGGKQIISMAFEESKRLNSKYISAEHLFLSLVKTGGTQTFELLDSLGVDTKNLVKNIENKIRIMNEVRVNKPGLDETAEKILKISYLEAKLFHSVQIEPYHILTSILRDDENEVTRQLAEVGVDHDSIASEIELRISANKILPEWSTLTFRENIMLLKFFLIRKLSKDDIKTDRKIVEHMAKDIFIKGGTSEAFQDMFYTFLDECKARKDEKEFLYLMDIFENIRGK